MPSVRILNLETHDYVGQDYVASVSYVNDTASDLRVSLFVSNLGTVGTQDAPVGSGTLDFFINHAANNVDATVTATIFSDADPGAILGADAVAYVSFVDTDAVRYVATAPLPAPAPGPTGIVPTSTSFVGSEVTFEYTKRGFGEYQFYVIVQAEFSRNYKVLFVTLARQFPTGVAGVVKAYADIPAFTATGGQRLILRGVVSRNGAIVGGATRRS
jgi:hypothetical protein